MVVVENAIENDGIRCFQRNECCTVVPKLKKMPTQRRLEKTVFMQEGFFKFTQTTFAALRNLGLNGQMNEH